MYFLCRYTIEISLIIVCALFTVLIQVTKHPTSPYALPGIFAFLCVFCFVFTHYALRMMMPLFLVQAEKLAAENKLTQSLANLVRAGRNLPEYDMQITEHYNRRKTITQEELVTFIATVRQAPPAQQNAAPKLALLVKVALGAGLIGKLVLFLARHN